MDDKGARGTGWERFWAATKVSIMGLLYEHTRISLLGGGGFVAISAASWFNGNSVSYFRRL